MLSTSTTIASEDSLVVFKRLLSSVKFANKITIYAMDMKGNKPLITLAKRYKATIKHVAKRPTVVEYIRTEQVKDASEDWVLVMDFDEVVTPALKREILRAIKSPQASAYAIPRRNFSLGYPLQFGGWGTDYVIRLFHRESFVNWPQEIHSTPVFKGKLGKLNEVMEHHKDQSVEFIVSKTNRYTDQEAQQFYKGNLSSVTTFTLLRKSIMEVIRRGFFKLGLLDRTIGVIQSIYQGFSVFISYAKLYERQINNNPELAEGLYEKQQSK